MVTAVINAARTTAKAHGVIDPHDLSNILSHASSAAIATVMATRARAG
jgi:hypothetical protein